MRILSIVVILRIHACAKIIEPYIRKKKFTVCKFIFKIKAEFEILEAAEITQQRRSEEVGRQDVVRVMRWAL